MRDERAGWILAGGRSSRMGSDKALLEIEGSTLLQRTAGELARVCDSVSVVGDPGRYAHTGLRVVPDAFAGEGPLAGIEAALAATGAEANLIVACDMPGLDAATLERLFEAAVESGADAVVPRYDDGRTEPLCAVYRKRCHGRVRELLESGIRSVTEALRLLAGGESAITYVRVDQRETFANLNTPAELARYRAEKRHG